MFKFNPVDASAGFPVYPKGEYQIELGEPKVFKRQGKNGKADNFGVMFVSKIVEAEDTKFKGKKIVINCFLHTPESQNMAKLIMMAAFGYAKNQEEAFDEFANSTSFNLNPDSGAFDDGWLQMKGRVLIQDLDVGTNDETGEPNQKTLTTRPYKG